MQFPNAANGSGKIFVGEVLALIFAICSGVAVALAAFAVSTVNNASDALSSGDAGAIADALESAADASAVATGSILGSGALILIGAIVGLIGFILVMVGCGQAGKDESSFKTALIVYVIIIALTAVGSFIARGNNTISLIVNTATTFCSIYAFFLIITGFKNLATNLGNTEIAQKGESITKIVCALMVAAIVLNFISSLIGGTIGGILALVGIIVSIVYYIIFIGYVGKGKNMLKGLS